MKWPWVSRDRLADSERFWREMADRSAAHAQECLRLYSEMTDRYCEAVINNKSSVGADKQNG